MKLSNVHRQKFRIQKKSQSRPFPTLLPTTKSKRKKALERLTLLTFFSTALFYGDSFFFLQKLSVMATGTSQRIHHPALLCNFQSYRSTRNDHAYRSLDVVDDRLRHFDDSIQNLEPLLGSTGICSSYQEMKEGLIDLNLSSIPPFGREELQRPIKIASIFEFMATEGAVITHAAQMTIPVKCFGAFDTHTHTHKKKKKNPEPSLDCLCNSIIVIDHLSDDTYKIQDEEENERGKNGERPE